MSVPLIPIPFQEETSKERKSKRKYVNRTWSRSSSDISGLWHQHRKPKRCKLNVQKNLNVKSKSFVATQAEELRSKLDPRYPSFIKSLVKSHVTGGFWMGLPAPFCQKHLPPKDTIITLETQSKKLYKTKYLVRKTGLSGGWKGFAISERLLIGDVLVFQLIADAKFKGQMKTTVVKLKRKSSASALKSLLHPHKEVKRQNVKSSILCQAEELRSRLAVQYPSFIKTMVKSHVASCFWMVYILRESNLTENYKSRVIQSLPTEVIRSGQEVGTLEHAIEHRPSSLSAVAQDKDQEFLSEDVPHIFQQAEKLKERSGLNPGNFKHVLLSDSFVVGSGIASFEEFQTVIDDLPKKEYDLPYDIKQSYYQLCCSKDTLLHVNLLKGINPFLIAGSIIETVNVAAVIKSCKLHNFNDELPIWDEKLKSLKMLGMNVGFLRSHLDRLQRIASDSEAAKNKQQYQNLCAEHDVSESKIKDLEAKLNEVLRVFDKRSGDVEELKLKIENHKTRFQKQVSVSWW